MWIAAEQQGNYGVFPGEVDELFVREQRVGFPVPLPWHQQSENHQRNCANVSQTHSSWIAGEAPVCLIRGWSVERQRQSCPHPAQVPCPGANVTVETPEEGISRR